MEIETISRDALKEKLERGDRFKLVMVLGESAWRARHIPGSLHFAGPDSMLRALSPDEEIVVYCSGPSCMASAFAYWFLKNRGYRNVRRCGGESSNGRPPACPSKASRLPRKPEPGPVTVGRKAPCKPAADKRRS